MTQIMTPSDKPITDGQIDKAVAAYKAMLVKHRTELASEAAQEVLGQDDYINEQVGVLRKRIEAVSKMIIRKVKVDRTKKPQQVLDATGRKQYTDRSVVDSMPCGVGEDVEVFFFKPEPSEYTRPGYMSDDDLEKALARRGLTADPYAQAKANGDDPAFADTHPNGTHWKNGDGKWCFATFDQWSGDGRVVSVDRDGGGWGDDWWFAGVRK